MNCYILQKHSIHGFIALHSCNRTSLPVSMYKGGLSQNLEPHNYLVLVAAYRTDFNFNYFICAVEHNWVFLPQ